MGSSIEKKVFPCGNRGFEHESREWESHKPVIEVSDHRIGSVAAMELQVFPLVEADEVSLLHCMTRLLMLSILPYWAWVPTLVRRCSHFLPDVKESSAEPRPCATCLHSFATATTWIYIYIYSRCYMRVSINGGTPKWMVSVRKIPI